MTTVVFILFPEVFTKLSKDFCSPQVLETCCMLYLDNYLEYQSYISMISKTSLQVWQTLLVVSIALCQGGLGS